MTLDFAINFFAGFLAIIIALALHEFGHAAMATKLGDPTPRLQGRLTLNPLAHLDPMGTLFILLTQLTGFGIGWGKPVETDPRYYEHFRKGMILTAVAGPAMNLAQGCFALGVTYALFISNIPLHGFLQIFLAHYVIINIGLILFNMLPLPMLDGGHVLANLLSFKAREDFYRLSRYGFVIVIALMWLGILSKVIGFLFSIVIQVLTLVFGSEFLSYLFSGLR
jgi:Zn-dependent protease